MINTISKLPIRIKILSSSVITLLLICAFIFTYYPYKDKEQLNDLMQQKNNSAAEMIALGVGMGMETSNFDLITKALVWAKKDSDLVFILVLDENNEVFASYNSSNLDLNIADLIEQKDVVEFYDKPYYVAKVPILYENTDYGTLILITSLEGLYNSISKKTLTTLFISIVILFFGILLSLLFSNMISKPLLNLRNAAGKIAMGNYDINIEVNSGDEIGVLGKSFNEMAKKLKLFINQLQNEIKEREQAENNLRKNQQLIHSIIDNSTTIICVKDIEGHYMLVNRQYETIFHIDREKIIGKTVHDIFSKEEADVFRKNDETVLETGVPLESEEIATLSDGPHTYLSTNFPLLDAVGKPYATASISTDITERKRRQLIQSALYKISEAANSTQNPSELYPLIHNVIRDLFPANNFYIAIMDSTEQMLSFPYFIDEYDDPPVGPRKLGKGLTEFVISTGESQLVPPERFNNLLEQGKVDSIGASSIDWLGVPLKMYGRTFGALVVQTYTAENRYREEEKNILEYVSNQIAMAIQRVKSIETLKESESKFRAVTQSASDAIVSINEKGKIFFWNKSAETMFGFSNEEIIGKSLQLIIPDRFWQSHEDGLKRFRETREPKVIGKIVELIGRKKDGTEFPIELSISNWDMKGKICYSGIIRDITERKQIERAMYQAKLEAEKAASAKAEFLANMSHEIRTPMNGVIGMTGLLLDTKLNAEQHEYAETIRASGDALLTIINDILDFSKMESGKLVLETQSFYLRDCIEDAFDFLSSKAAEKDLEIAYLFETNVPEVISSDITRLRQILINLVGNALKFTNKGEITVTVNAEETGDDKYRIHFAVKDTGIGIPEDKIETLFKSFSQADSSTTRKFGGTGLGLAISKHLSEIMGGRIWVESEAGKGSVFHFTILAELGKAPEREYMVDPSPVLRGQKVLVVDDNEASRKLISIQVSSWGMNPVAVSSGFDALELISEGESFDLAILDMQMPNMDGAMLASEIRKYHKCEDLPLIMLTSIDKRKEDVKHIENYFSAYLVKPIKQSLLYTKIISVFSTERKNDKPERGKMLFDPKMVDKHPLRILIADDNVINQKVAERMLQKMGYRPDIVSNGLEILQALEQAPYDLIFIDVHMPEMDGLEATRRICDKYNKDNRPLLVAMTADAMPGDKEKCIEAGMDDYICKPVKIPELEKALKKAFILKLAAEQKLDF